MRAWLGLSILFPLSSVPYRPAKPSCCVLYIPCKWLKSPCFHSCCFSSCLSNLSFNYPLWLNTNSPLSKNTSMKRAARNNALLCDLRSLHRPCLWNLSVSIFLIPINCVQIYIKTDSVIKGISLGCLRGQQNLASNWVACIFFWKSAPGLYWMFTLLIAH